MKASTFVAEDRLVAQAVDLLVDKLGPVEAGRFLSLPQRKRMESVQRHRLWQSKLDQDDFFDEVFGRPPVTSS